MKVRDLWSLCVLTNTIISVGSPQFLFRAFKPKPCTHDCYASAYGSGHLLAVFVVLLMVLPVIVNERSGIPRRLMPASWMLRSTSALACQEALRLQSRGLQSVGG